MCTNPIYLETQQIRVPCGRCRACRIKRSADWTMRISHELHTFRYEGTFLTLTYDDDHLPEGGTLVKEDLQKFFKRLRKRLKKDNKKIKYYACGEYGENTQRPHYHAIILGLSVTNGAHRKAMSDSWDKCDWNNPAIKRGAFGTVTPDSIRYTTDYIQKKFSNPDEAAMKAHYGDRLPEFQCQSKGIGERYALSLKSTLEETGKIPYKGIEVSMPKYYMSKVEIPIETRRRNKREAITEKCKKYNISAMDEFLNRRLSGTSLYPQYADELAQHNLNLIAKQKLVKAKKL